MKNIKSIDMKHLKSFQMFENEGQVAPAEATKAPAEMPVDRAAVEAVVKKQSPEQLQQFVNELAQKLGLSVEQLKDEELVKSKLAELTKNESFEVDETNEGLKDMFASLKAKAAKILTWAGLGTVAGGLINLAIDAGFNEHAINAADYTGATLHMSSMAIASIIALVAGTAMTVVGMKNLPKTATAGAELSDAQKAQIARRKARFGR
jgi:hypothetical protein